MKQIFFALITLLGLNACSQDIDTAIPDVSLKIEIADVQTPCDCNAYLEHHLKEEIQLWDAVRSGNCTAADSAILNDEHIKRVDHFTKMMEHCNTIHKTSKKGRKCENQDLLEELDKKLSKLRGY